MNGLRRPIRSESQPEKMRSTVAVHSATPSITPRLATEARSVPVTNSGSTGMIISVETSVKSDAQPSARTLRRPESRSGEAVGAPAEARGAAGATAVPWGTGGSVGTAREPSMADRARWYFRRSMVVLLLVVHGLSAVLLLGALTHQALAVWWPAERRTPRWWDALRAVHPERYVTAVNVLFVATLLLGAVGYAPFVALARARYLDAHVPWAVGLFQVKEHAVALGLALLPAYAAAWRQSATAGERRALTTLLTLFVWWSFIVGHVVNNAKGL